MWKPDIDKMQRQDESERLEQVENDIQLLKQIVAWLQIRIEKLEKKNDK